MAPPVPGRAAANAAQAADHDPAQDPGLVRVRDLSRAGKYDEAEALARSLLEKAENERGAESREVAAALDELVNILMRARKTGGPEALALARRAVAIKEKLLGPNDLGVAFSLRYLASVLRTQGRMEEAETAARRAVAIREAALGAYHPEVARALGSLARVDLESGNLDSARAHLDRAIAIFEREGVPEYPDMDEILSLLGILLDRRGDIPGSIENFERVLAIREKALGPDHPDVMRVLGNLGLMYKSAGRFKESRMLLDRVLAADEARFGPDHASVATGLYNLAMLDLETEDVVSAQPRFEGALAIRTRALGEEHVDVTYPLVGLCEVHHRLGDDEQARALCERALRIREKTLGPDHFRVAELQQQLATLDVSAGDYAQARMQYERALAIIEKAAGPESPSAGTILGDLAVVLRKSGQISEALRLQQTSLRILEKTLGPDNPLTGRAADNLALDLALLGREQEARAMHERAVALLERALPSPSPSIAAALRGLALSLARSGDGAGSLDAALRAEAMGRDYQDLVTRVLPERQALLLASARPVGLDVVLSLAAGQPGNPDIAARAWDALIRSRALVLDEMAARRRDLTGADDADTARLAEAFVAASGRLANLLVKSAGASPVPGARSSIEKAIVARDDAERALAARSARFRSEQASRATGLRDVAAARAEGTALVAYVLYERQVPVPASAAYLAFVLPAATGSPVVVPLGTAEEIDGLVGRWRAQVMHEAASAAGARGDPEVERACRLAGSDLRRRAWDPIAAHLGEARRVVVVPDGTLNVVNILALPAGEADYLVERLPPLQYLSAERDVVSFVSRRKPGAGLLVMGGPAYDATQLAAARKERRPSTPDSPPAATATVFRGKLSECGGFRALTFQPLPGSASEAREIERLWKGGEALRLADAEATEASFKALAPGRSVLHLATHGFFLDPGCAADASGGGRGENPLRLSGLALAGANLRQQAGPDQEDGILTAEEIAALDLSGVEWAVLSACDTGQGVIQAGEGVLGLRRAFQIAGARAMVLSLWPVEDRAARSWMRRLYQGRQERRLDTAAAARAASLELLQERREREQSTHPVYWGGFVVAGDWR